MATLQGCKSIAVKAQPAAEQSTYYLGGTQVIVSATANVVSIRPENLTFPSDEKPTFSVTAMNGQQIPLDFSTENISARLNGSPVHVLTYEELVKEVETQAAIETLAAAMSSVGRSMEAARAGHQYQYTYAPIGAGYYPTTVHTYNAEAAQQAQSAARSQTNADFQRIQTQTDSAMAALNTTIMRRQTVFPGASHGGYVKLEPISLAEGANTLSITVEFGGENHEFTFALSEAED